MPGKTENKNGYKHTPLGWIPEEWSIKTVEDIAVINSETLKEKTDPNYSFHYLDLSSVDKGKISLPKEKIFYKDAPSRAKRILKTNDVIMATVRPNLQAFAIANFNIKDIICSTGFALLRTRLPEDSHYLYHCLFSYFITRQINDLVVGSNYPALNNDDVENLLLPYPESSDERNKITKILTTWDKAIEATEKLIESKQKLKNGLMQKLLTGKKRLAGFKDKWNEKKLGEIFRISAGGDFNNDTFSAIKDAKHPYPVYSNSLTQEGLYGFTETYRYEGNCITVTARGTIGAANYRDHRFDAIGRVLVLEPKSEMNNFFISEFINNKINFFVESTGVPQLTAPHLSKYKVLCPGPSEQNAIARILQMSDAEIKNLNVQLEKLKEQKKGLMQVLLTGKVRVKTN